MECPHLLFRFRGTLKALHYSAHPPQPLVPNPSRGGPDLGTEDFEAEQRKKFTLLIPPPCIGSPRTYDLQPVLTLTTITASPSHVIKNSGALATGVHLRLLVAISQVQVIAICDLPKWASLNDCPFHLTTNSPMGHPIRAAHLTAQFT